MTFTTFFSKLTTKFIRLYPVACMGTAFGHKNLENNSFLFCIFAKNSDTSMHNDPELQNQGKYLGTFTKDFVLIADTLKEASYQIRSRGFAYPIFAICKEDLSIGSLLVNKAELHLDWNYYVSYLSEFEQLQLVTDKEAFEQAYKQPDEFCCLFVVDKDFINFVFLPYPED